MFHFQVIEMKRFFMLVQNLLFSSDPGLFWATKNFSELYMPSRNSESKSGIVGIALALACATSQATPATFFAVQGAKLPLTSTSPPTLTTALSVEVAKFNAAITTLGSNEYESAATGNRAYGFSAGPGTFAYAGGTATLSGGSVVGVAQSAPSLGRYNMTTGLSSGFSGHWLEGFSDFSYTFDTAISAIGFFGTDFGDLNVTFELDLFNDLTSTTPFFTYSITPSSTKANGNLLFLGIASDVAFNKAVFKIPTAVPADVLGFDSLIVGNALTQSSGGSTTPEPTSLALTGLALALAGHLARRRRA